MFSRNALTTQFSLISRLTTQRAFSQTPNLWNRFQKFVGESSKNVKEIHPLDVKKMISSGEPFTLIDVREDSEWNKSRVAGSVHHLSKGVIERDIEKLVAEPEAKIVVYCAGGIRSILAADNLQKMGYKNVLSMQGGIGEWARAGLEIEGEKK